MATEGSSFSTPMFTIERIRPEVNLIRYAEGIVINAALLEESMRVRKEVQEGAPYATIAVFPPSATYDPDLFDGDLYKDEVPEHFSKALALVMEHGNLRDVAERYYSQYPPFFQVRIFDDVSASLLWVEGIMGARHLS